MHPVYYHRPPSRLFWFFLGGVTATWFITSRPDRDRAEWRAKCLAWKARYSLEDSQSPNQSQTQAQGAAQARDTASEDEKYMWWKLRSERDAERRNAQEFQKQMDHAKYTVSFVLLDYNGLLNGALQVLDATEKGLESLRASLESLTKVGGNYESTVIESKVTSGPKQVVHEQRASREQTRAPSPEADSDKRLV